MNILPRLTKEENVTCTVSTLGSKMWKEERSLLVFLAKLSEWKSTRSQGKKRHWGRCTFTLFSLVSFLLPAYIYQVRNLLSTAGALPRLDMFVKLVGQALPGPEGPLAMNLNWACCLKSNISQQVWEISREWGDQICIRGRKVSQQEGRPWLCNPGTDLFSHLKISLMAVFSPRKVGRVPKQHHCWRFK